MNALTKAQRAALEAVCQTNGGGVRIKCAVDDEGAAAPTNRVYRKLFDLGLIQGKAGGFETVVHTREGLALVRQLQGEQS